MYYKNLDSADKLAIGATETWLVGPSEATDGLYCVMHQILPAGLVSPAHRHRHQHQTAIILSGTLGFWVEGFGEVEAKAGSFVTRPIGLFHAVWNIWDEPAVMLELTTPGKEFEAWMRELSSLVTSGTADENGVRALAAEKYGIEFAGPDDPDGSRRYGPTKTATFWQQRP